ncbi:MAG: transporter ATP-binding protein [Microvirga sp.]|jgi:putative spermidine/putrescine transport system ATP-binding protein|nr:transporter ATP-binding protein [Microvirga sp.]
MAAQLLLEDTCKRYGSFYAVDHVSLLVEKGQFLTLLGPSGSGKTTILMAIAGFTKLTSGSIKLQGRPIDHLMPEQRNFGMVFQGYALFPHLSVAENVAFPLNVRRVSRADCELRVKRVLDMVQLVHLRDRKPAQLSGGQQQRVALARALVFNPDLLLLDEPLSALDKKLRADLQVELKALHERVGLTFIYVTHDQEEALSMSDRIAILNHGKLEQVGTPSELYECPQSRFVAGFLGRSNFISGQVDQADGESFTYVCQGTRLRQQAMGKSPLPQETVTIALRPEKIRISQEHPHDADNVVSGRITHMGYFGANLNFSVETEHCGKIDVVHPAWNSSISGRSGEPVWLSWDANASNPVAGRG